MGVEQYRSLFVSESEEHLQSINKGVLSLEKNPSDVEILNTIFRSAHTLKGMSATMGFDGLTKLTHKMEDVLDVFRTQKIPVSSEIVDILFNCLDMLEALLEEIKTEKDLNIDVSHMVVRLESIIPTISARHMAQEAEKPIGLTQIECKNLETVAKDLKLKLFTVRVTLAEDCQLKAPRAFMVFSHLGRLGEVVKSQPSIEDLELGRFGRVFSVLFLTKCVRKEVKQVIAKVMEVDAVDVRSVADISALLREEMLADPESIEADSLLPGGKKSNKLQQLSIKKIQSIRVSTSRLDKLMNVVGELVIAKIRLMQISTTQHVQGLSEILTNIDRLTGELQDEVMQARLIPIAQVFDRFPRMVRDLARSEQKQINLEISGGEIELDRTVLDEIADPLVHLLRNSIDHGIELPADRKQSGKKPAGNIYLSARRERTFVLIEVSDDGKGISPEMLRSTAVSKGFMSEEDVTKLSDKEVLNIITMPGFSSASTITDTSGRGVGMDVVKMKIESLGGSLFFESEAGKGSCFKLKLPLTVAIIRAMLVRVGTEKYATPIANIAETVKVKTSKIKRIEKVEVINLRNEVLPLVRLQRLLNIESAETSAATAGARDDDISIVVVESGGSRAGLVVEEVLGQQEVVIKSVGSMLKGIRGFAGATILGDGTVALILDVGTLVV